MAEKNKITRLLQIGIIGALLIFIGDVLMGWGVRNPELSGMEGQLSAYLTVSDGRMVFASILGFIGVPLAVIGHYGIYKLMKPYSKHHARLYGLGMLGFLAFGGAGVHASSIEAAFVYKYISIGKVSFISKFALYFLLPMYVILIFCWIMMVYAHMSAILKGSSPFPRWSWIFSMLPATLAFSFVGLFGNYEIVNALVMGAFSLGNIWTLCTHLLLVHTNKLRNETCCLKGLDNKL